MEIVHRLSLRVEDDAVQQQLREAGIEVGRGLETFEVGESHPNWSRIAQIAAERRAIDIEWTTFTKQELRAASRLELGSAWHHGYPQPEDWYLERTYDLRDYCPTCGIGAIQNAPFRMKGEPRWGKRSLLQMNWVFDEYFVEPQAWERVLKPLGLETQPVLQHRTGKPLETVLQITNAHVAESTLQLGDHPATWCPRCERKKYLPFTRGCFPAFASETADAPIMKTREWFGSGASAARGVIIPQRVYAAIAANKLQGCIFTTQCR